MGDILGGVFGSGYRTTQSTQPDPVSQAMNQLRYQQLNNLFSQASVDQFAQPDTTGAYTPSAGVQQLGGNLMSMQDYENLGLNAASNYVNTIARPQIMSAAALQGQESSGAVPEAIARANAQVALPFIQNLPQAYGQYAQAMMPIADYSRSLREQDLLRQQGVVETALTGLPYTPGSESQGRRSSQPLFNFFGQG